MTEQELNKLLDKAIGTKGQLKVPSYWMHKILTNMQSILTDSLKYYVDYNITKIDAKIPKYVSDLYNDRNYVTKN
jgi:hypothetical protein